MSHTPSTTNSGPQRSLAQELVSGGFLRVLLVQVAFGLSFSAFLLLPKFLKTVLHASATEIGWISGMGLVWAAVCAPFVGAVAARFDRKKLLAVSLLMEGGAALAFVFVTEVGPLAYVLRAFQGVAFVLVFNCTTTMLADSLPPSQLAKGIGYLGLTMLMTNAAAPLVAEPLASAYGFQAAFLAAGAVVLLALVCVPFLPEAKVHAREAQPSRAFSPALNAVYYGSLLMGGGLGVMFTFLQPFALSMGVEKVGQFFLGHVAAAAFVRTVLGGVSDRVGPLRVATFTMAVYVVVNLLGAELRPGWLVPLGVGVGFCHGLIYPALSAAGLSITSPRQRPVFMGWFSCAFNLGFAGAVLALGPVADALGYPAVFQLTSVVFVSGAVVLFRADRARRQGRGGEWSEEGALAPSLPPELKPES